jgi:RND superfamily putative drug exporter
VLSRLGRWCHDHRWKVVIFWVVALLIGNGVLAGAGGASTDADFSLPNVESKRGTDILEDSFGGQGAGFGGSIVFKADQGVDDPEVRAAMEDLFEKVREVDGVTRVASPYDEGGERQIASEGPDAGKIAFAQVDLDTDLKQSDFEALGTAVRGDIADVDVEGLQVEAGGEAFAEFENPTSEALGVAFAIFILILAFGSVLAMGLPIGVALAGIGAGTFLAGFISFVIHPPSFASLFGTMIGLGVGIDYALFIVTRHRENLHKGYGTRQSIAIALDTAGRAVLFAGTTVVISILGMIVMQLSFVTGLAVAVATVVSLTMLASVTLLPALLGFAGDSVEVTRRRGLITSGFVAIALVGVGLKFPPLIILGALPAVVLVLPNLLATIFHFAGRRFGFANAIGGFFDRLVVFPVKLHEEVSWGERKPLRETTAYRWSRVIQHRPWPAVIIGVVLLGFLAVPLSSLRLGFSDTGTYPEDTTTRKAYDLLADGFGPGYNGSLMLVAEVPQGASDADFQPIVDAVADDPGVARVNPPFVSEDGRAIAVEVLPTTSPQDEATTDLVKRLRDDVIPAAEDGTGFDVSVSGAVAVNVDFAHYLSERLVYFLAAVLVLSFLLLMAVFRSLLVPLKAVVMNLLSIGAAYGVIVAGFQWGWLGGVLGFDKAPIEPWIPMMMFAIVFGLSMDYEVFLLSRVKEEWLRTRDARTSVADGLAATARVITAAALIMVFVFGAFLLEDNRVVKLMGVGLATAVLLDATIVRMLLVPATMELLGDKNWWLPKWLDRILPNIDVEGHTEPDEPVSEGPDEPHKELEPVGQQS